jgi:para-aminobenzoate synthetase
LRCLLIDNYDSFTYNLADYIGETFGEMPTVVHNNQYSWDEISQTIDYDCIVVSPGPGNVTKQSDFQISRNAVAQNEVPVFGVCLGFQGIAHQHGGRILHCPVPYHGRTSDVFHENDPMFANIKQDFKAVRYHSLMVELPKNGDLIQTASTDNGIIMGLRHKKLPKWGVQFHPESILTENGHQLITNFRNLAHKHNNKAHIQVPVQLDLKKIEKIKTNQKTKLDIRQIVSKKLNLKSSSENIFSTLFANKKHRFWLDSQSVSETKSRFSFMGCVNENQVINYKINEDDTNFVKGHTKLKEMDGLLSSTKVTGTEALPFNFVGGLVGYFSYEMKALFSASKHFENKIPDMIWMHVDQFIAFDHQSNEVYLVANAALDDLHIAQQWLDKMKTEIDKIELSDYKTPPTAKILLTELEMEMDASYDDYISAIRSCQDSIIEGDSYEVCLTNHFSFKADINPYDLYQNLRKGNAAPFGAFIQSDNISILSTSPERFLAVSPDGRVQAKPIKGTCERSSNPEQDKTLAKQLSESIKDRAENLMIVDLMRNDLNRVSKQNSVKVPDLMKIESYKTVHQMVSTVESDLADDQSLIDLIRATYPGGSITGAPKLRTMEIIDDLEKSARGVYCGAIGYLGYNRVADLNIGIRTLSYDGDKVRFGAGGAITYLSHPEAEFNEIMLKAEALIKPLWGFFGRDSDNFRSEVNDNKLKIFNLEKKLETI